MPVAKPVTVADQPVISALIPSTSSNALATPKPISVKEAVTVTVDVQKVAPSVGEVMLTVGGVTSTEKLTLVLLD